MKKSFMQYLAAALFIAALPVTAQEEAALVPALDAKAAAAHIVVVEDEDGASQIVGSDNLPAPDADARAFNQREAVRQRVATNQKGGRTHQVARGQYVDFPVERTDRVFVMLVEFGEKAGFIANPTDKVPQLSTVPGPLHNQIAQPDRATDNTTIWQADYNREHYVDMYFNQMVAYYKSQSSGRYTFNGDVAHWVKVPFNGSRYGANTMGTAGMWTLIADTINTWTAAQVASGKTPAEVTEYLRSFDRWDRYDYDRDGNFDEADGYIDHFQIVHAGPGEETNTTAYADMIWSHRWNAFYHLEGWSGPSWNRDGGVQFGGGWGANPNGGTFGSANGHMLGVTTLDATAATVTNAYPAMPTGIWVNDYTVQPENGGLGVFAHEYGHDLGLPDHYDTAGGTNGTGYWTIMSSGSYLGEGGLDVGARPGDMNAWDKLQLGWLSYDQADFGRFSTHKLGPAEFATKAAQAVVIPLPSNQNFKYDFGAVVAASANGNAWGSGTGDNYDASMTRSIAVPATTNPVLTMRLSYNIEANWDYAYVSISTNGGAAWTNLAAAGITTTTNANGQNLGNGITGSSGASWRVASFDLAPYAGQTVLLRLRYVTDAYVSNPGVIADDITVGTFVDRADASPNGWTLNKFSPVSPDSRSITNNTHFYIAEYRQYKGYDSGLRTGPYAGTSYLNGKVGHYAYQDGLLITYADYDHGRNNTSVTPGEGFALQIDARPAPMTRLGVLELGSDRRWNFGPWLSTVQTFDATFGLRATDALTLPFVGGLPPLPGSPKGTPNRRAQFEVEIPSTAAVPFFSDMTSYWSSSKPDSSVILPQTGTSLRVISQSAQDSFMLIQVNPSSN